MKHTEELVASLAAEVGHETEIVAEKSLHNLHEGVALSMSNGIAQFMIPTEVS